MLKFNIMIDVCLSIVLKSAVSHEYILHIGTLLICSCLY